MKKVINESNRVVEEMIEGFLAAYGRYYRKVPGVKGIVRQEKQDKVAVVIGGGSGHEPMFLGFAGEGLADGVAIGNVFAAPTPDTVYEVAKAADSGKGVLFVYGNYAGDVLNFDMGAELAENEGIATKTVLVTDDVASAPPERRGERRGIAGDVLVIKIAGAAAANGLDLEEVTRLAKKANDNTRSIGVALTPGSIPDTGTPTFTLPEDEIEFGMGIHGEPGVKRTKLMKADELTDHMLQAVLEDLPFQAGDEVCVLINGLGSTTLMELLIVHRRVSHVLADRGITVYDSDVNSFCTTQEMGGFSITLMKLDEELKKYYNYPAYSPFYAKQRLGE
ncbi:dihydroxyacetone kinase subunit DhaK [Brevibacillus marinus]|uniref:dihydroxyacetone kinase subunit DhaK n=1 Tax=Brevibacillus marinus TaxID=2496837 RepID=UPI0019D258D8|nr:dihydroxyacetone kinase subunit DhaK [Brevibacillus marinus]